MRLRLVLRRLGRTPMFTIITALTLAVGIGANSAIFSVINGVMLKPLPYRHADELIDLNHTAPGVNFPDADPAPFLQPFLILAALTLFLAVLIGAIVSGDGRSNWYKGVQLTLVYAMIAILFYFLPSGAQ